MKKPQNPNPGDTPQQPAKPAAGRQPQVPARPAAPAGRTPAPQRPAAGQQRPVAPKPKPAAPAELPPRPVNGSPMDMVNYLSGQIQLMASRLESLREQGAGQTTEFKQLEGMLSSVQEKLLQAQARIERG